jgi:hypothetical protein
MVAQRPQAALKRASEHEIQRQILDWLKIMGFFYWRNNTGTSGPMFHNGKRRFVRFGTPGSPDIFVVDDGQIYGIEVKAEGKKVSELQMNFGMELTRAGGKYIVASKLEDVQEYL